MKKTIYFVIVLLSVIPSMNSCREQSDDILSYGMNDKFNFSEANSSFEGQFKALWTAMNCNYGIWDYEAEHGVDWDKTYTDYLPKFQELDQRIKDGGLVDTDELQNLYTDIFSPLHDGHFWVQIKNLSGEEYAYVKPSNLRNADRSDFNIINEGFYRPSLAYYLNATGDNRIVDYDGFDTNPNNSESLRLRQQSILSFLRSELDSGIERKDITVGKEEALRQAIDDFSSDYVVSYPPYYDYLFKKYQYMGFTDTTNPDMCIQYARFSDDILYLNFSDFFITGFLLNWNNGTTCGDSIDNRVGDVYSKWILQLQDPQIKGVIIDVRNNGGGITNDYQRVLGALLPVGDHQVASARVKTGTGRLDYSPLTPEIFLTMPDSLSKTENGITYKIPRAVITQPVVVLANCNSVSMAEVTCLGAKQMENARVVGTQTWGGLSLLHSTTEQYSMDYAGRIGVQSVTPFYAYIPTNVTISDEEGILEGKGVTPDIEVQLDLPTFLSTGRDNQLERALQYIRTGN